MEMSSDVFDVLLLEEALAHGGEEVVGMYDLYFKFVVV